MQENFQRSNGREEKSSAEKQQNELAKQSMESPSEKAPNTLNGEVSAFYELSASLCRQGRHIEAITNLKEALKLMPNNSRILELIGSACYSIREYKDAAAYLKESIKANPNNDNTYNTLSVALHKIGKDDEAIKWLNAGLEINPTNTSLIYNLSSAHKSRGNISTATKLLKSAIRLNPGNADALNNLGLINQECGKTDDAIHCFQEST